MPARIEEAQVLDFMRDNLLAYAVVAYKEFKAYRHLKLIAEKLEVVEAGVRAGEPKRLAIFLPPRHGKSLLCSKIFPSWFLGRNPSKYFLSISYSNDFVTEFGSFVLKTMRSPQYQLLFNASGRPLVAPSHRARDHIETVEDGAYYAVGVGGSITGRGAHLLLIDDLIKNRPEADSVVYRDRLKQLYGSAVRTRLQPGGSIVLVMARWDEDDIAGEIIKESGEDWDTVTIPAVIETPEQAQSDPLGRKLGEAICEEFYSQSEILLLKPGVGDRNWNSLYQQNTCGSSQKPGRPFGSIRPQIYRFSPRQWVTMHPDMEVSLSSDLSFGSTSSTASYQVHQVWGSLWLGDRRAHYLLDLWRGQSGFLVALAELRRLVKEWYVRGDRIVIEKKANGPATIETLEQEIPGIVPFDPGSQSKLDRAHAVLPLFERGNEIYFPDTEVLPSVSSLLSEMKTFPFGESDDCIDAMTQYLLWAKDWYCGDYLNAFNLSA